LIVDGEEEEVGSGIGSIDPISSLSTINHGLSTPSPQHLIHRDIMRLRKRVRDHLKGKADADFKGIGAGLGEEAVVESAAATEAAAAGVEGEAGAEEGVDFLNRNLGAGGGGFEDAVASGTEIAAGVEGEVVADDSRIDPGEVGAGEDGGGQIDLAGEWRIYGDGVERGVGLQPLAERGACGGGIRDVLTQALPQGGAEIIFSGW
jgi:hypothetical protein